MKLGLRDEGDVAFSQTAERFIMRTAANPSTYLKAEELRQIAAAKLEEAEALPDGPERQQVLRSAQSFDSLARVKGWVSSELQPPK
jgi:hypothetical protein